MNLQSNRQGNRQGNKGALFALSSIPLIMTLGNSMLIPVLPEIRRQLSISSFETSLLITVYSIMAIPLIPIAGYLSDRIGRKKVIIPSLIIVALGGGLCAFVSMTLDRPYPWLVAGRVLQGIGAAGAAPIVMPLVGDLFEREQEVSSGLGVIETSNTFGKVLSPILGSLIAWLAWFAPFAAIPVISLIAVILVLLMVKAPKRKEEPVPFKRFFHTLKDIFKEKGRWLYAIFFIGGMAMFILFAFLVYLSDMLEEKFFLKGVWKGFVLAIPLALLCTASYITGRIIGENKGRMKLLITAGFFLAAATLLLSALFDSLLIQLCTLSLTGIGIGVALPCLDALITEGIEKEERGTVTSLFSSLRFAGVAVGPPVASLLASRSPDALFWTLAGSGLATAFVALFFIKPGKNKEKRPSPKVVPKGRNVLQ